MHKGRGREEKFFYGLIKNRSLTFLRGRGIYRRVSWKKRGGYRFSEKPQHFCVPRGLYVTVARSGEWEQISSILSECPRMNI